MRDRTFAVPSRACLLGMRPIKSLGAAVPLFHPTESRCPSKITTRLESRENWPERRASRRSRTGGPLVQRLPTQARRWKYQRRTPPPEIRLLGTGLESEPLERCRRARGAHRASAPRQGGCADRTFSISFSPTASPRYGVRGRGGAGQHPGSAIPRAASASAGVFHLRVPLCRLRRTV